MNISEEQLKELILRVLSDLEVEKRAECVKGPEQTLYMLYASPRSERYMESLRKMEGSDTYDTVPVIPPSRKNMRYEARLGRSVPFGKTLYRSGKMLDNLDRVVTLFPVVPRDALMKTTLCISDTYETSWIAECTKQGSRVVLLPMGLGKFSGDEKPACRKRIMEYYRQVLEPGARIYSTEEPSGRAPYEISCEGTDRTMACRVEDSTCTLEPDEKKEKVTLSSNVEQFVPDGVVYLRPGDTVMDLAKDRAGLLRIVFK